MTRRTARLTALPVLIMMVVMGTSPVLSQSAGRADEEVKRSGIIYFPIMFSTPETGFAFGSSAGLFVRPAGATAETRPTMVNLLGIYTAKKQLISQIGTDAYLQDGKYHVIASFEFKKFPDTFWGIGNDLSVDADESFTSRRGLLSLDIQRRIRPGLNIGLQYVFARSTVIEIEPGGLLDSGDIRGATGSTISGAGLIVNLDTRNHIYYPTEGRWYQFSMRFYGDELGSEYRYSRYNLDLREYIPIGSDQILACQAYGLFIPGNPPFESLARLGGERVMRGIYTGRYADQNMLTFQAEYRKQVWRRIGMVAFAGAGDVARRINDFRVSEFKFSAGFGIRFSLIPDEKMNLRLDWAWGKATSGMYITVMEAF
ncbi:BamA/TamA family outer membrane protein [Gemmatimonadota bacterium]